MIMYTKREDKKLGKMMDGVKCILESIDFKQEERRSTYGDGSLHHYYKGQSNEQIKNKIKVARAMLIDIAKELK
jgi:hypothetical protein